MRPLVVGITGASGAPYAKRLLEVLLSQDQPIELIYSSAGRQVAQHELGWELPADPEGQRQRLLQYLDLPHAPLSVYNEKDFTAPPASGSHLTRGMVIVPTSMGTVAAIRAGLSHNLIQRAADVCLKEGRPLTLLPRETPLSATHLDNLAQLARLGVAIVPAMPAFYHQPQTLDDQINFVVGKLLDRLGFEQLLFERWGSANETCLD